MSTHVDEPAAAGRQLEAGLHDATVLSAEEARGAAGAGRLTFLDVGRKAWALVGILLATAAIGFLLEQVHVVIVPLVIALFPATLLTPLVSWLRRRGWRPGLAAAVVLAASLVLVGGFFYGLVAVISAGAEDLQASLVAGLNELQASVERLPLAADGGLQALLETAQQRIVESEEFTAGAMTAAVLVFEVLAGLALLIIALFFYLKEGVKLAKGVRDTFPVGLQHDVEVIGTQAWTTAGSYFRGQFLVALFDAVLIGIGLLVLQVPLALPLAMVVLVGALFPIVGALVSGSVAVLVALADGGLVSGLLVLALIVAVQQIEGHVFQPMILSRAIDLHPLVVIAGIAGGAIAFGVLGAFLALPVTASIARAIDYLRGKRRGQDAVTA